METKLTAIKNGVSDMDQRIADYKKLIAQLTAAGTTQAKFYIRKDLSSKTGEIIETYYLLHPMRDGKRKKEYVGRNPVEIRKATERQERYAKRKTYIDTLSKLEGKRLEIDVLLNRVGRVACGDNLMSIMLFSDDIS